MKVRVKSDGENDVENYGNYEHEGQGQGGDESECKGQGDGDGEADDRLFWMCL